MLSAEMGHSQLQRANFQGWLASARYQMHSSRRFEVHKQGIAYERVIPVQGTSIFKFGVKSGWPWNATGYRASAIRLSPAGRPSNNVIARSTMNARSNDLRRLVYPTQLCLDDTESPRATYAAATCSNTECGLKKRSHCCEAQHNCTRKFRTRASTCAIGRRPP